jgi:hypothetical protein
MHFDGVTGQLCKVTRQRLRKFLECRSKWAKLKCQQAEIAKKSYENIDDGSVNGLFQLLSAPPLLRNPFLMSILPWNFPKFSCKIYPFLWNFLVKITLAHGISILN